MHATTLQPNTKHSVYMSYKLTLLTNVKYEGRPINKLQNGIIPLIFKI